MSNLWRLREYLRPYAGRMAAMLVLAVFASLAALATPRMIQAVIDGPVTRADDDGLWWLAAAILALGVAEAFLVWLRRYIQATVALGVEADMRRDIYAHVQKLHAGFHDRFQTGQLLSRATGDLGRIRRFAAWGMIFLVINVFTYVAVIAQLLQIYWPLGLVVAASAVPLFFLSRSFARGYIRASRAEQDQAGEVANTAEETAQGIRVVKAFGRSRHVIERFEGEAAKLRDISVGKVRMLSKSWSMFDAIPNLVLAAVLIGGSIAVAAGAMTIGELVAFVTLQLMLVWPIEALGWIIANGNEAMTAADRIFDVLDTEPAIVDRPGATDLDRADAKGHLRFEGVRFGYEGTGKEILTGLDLDVRPGETLAIAGVTGCGKTTLLSLAPRLYDVTEGRVTIDGRDVRDLTLSSLRRNVATAFEDPTLFSMSVRENLTLGREDATEADIEEALQVAQAEFVYDLPWGLDTRIGEQGLSLSGGQRQRLALARAVIVKPAVLILDDPLSALDVHTEELVERALASVLKGTTALVAVHRPSTVALADRVALLQDGTIVAVGTHSELLESTPAYRAVLSAEADTVGAAA
ncbi:ABC transporter ATP-binding protein [Actinorhabdospora filicis]|uniref:ABC transporter ATP-binding protein n=2 Tax=Actinorhabdospora filicis TaxID=1785913 RepID=A0A9W6SFR5_9ACTN|nr:ABC transporter ATP-binding protein [Actinorhabdospora filicis]